MLNHSKHLANCVANQLLNDNIIKCQHLHIPAVLWKGKIPNLYLFLMKEFVAEKCLPAVFSIERYITHKIYRIRSSDVYNPVINIIIIIVRHLKCMCFYFCAITLCFILLNKVFFLKKLCVYITPSYKNRI